MSAWTLVKLGEEKKAMACFRELLFDGTNNQMMLAIYRANPEAFLGNMNALKASAILRVPGEQEVGDIGVSEANSEATEQHAAWAGKSAEPRPTEVEGQLELVVRFILVPLPLAGKCQTQIGVEHDLVRCVCLFEQRSGSHEMPLRTTQVI